MISLSCFTLSGQAGCNDHFYVLFWFVLDYIFIFPSLTFISFRLFSLFFGYLWTLSMCQFLYHLISFFLGKANVCASGCSQLWQLFHVIRSDMLTVYHSPAIFFPSVQCFFQLCINLSSYLIYNRVHSLCNYCF